MFIIWKRIKNCFALVSWKWNVTTFPCDKNYRTLYTEKVGKNSGHFTIITHIKGIITPHIHVEYQRYIYNIITRCTLKSAKHINNFKVLLKSQKILSAFFACSTHRTRDRLVIPAIYRFMCARFEIFENFNARMFLFTF